MSVRKLLFCTATPLVLALSVNVSDANTGKNWVFPDYDTVKDQKITGDSFTDQLARNYQQMSVYEYQEMNDYFDAETYAERSLAAQAGKAPAPFEPQNWGIDDEQNMKDLLTARAQLVHVLNQGAPSKAPKQAAEAQAKYDCWVEQQEEGWQTKEIAACRSDFWTAMENLNDQMMKQAQSQMQDRIQMDSPSLAMDEIARQIVYFDFDQSKLNSTARSKIDQLVKEVSPLTNYNITVEGHADRSGPADYNAILAAKRAETVRQELIRQGLTVAEIEQLQTTSEGETDPMIATADGVREPQNRRVEIVISGENKKTASLQTKTYNQ